MANFLARFKKREVFKLTMAKKRVRKWKENKGENILKSPWILGVVIVLLVMAGIVLYNFKDLLLSPCAGYIATDYDNDGVPAVYFDSYCKVTKKDNCQTIYNPDQNNKYCNPFYGGTLLDSDDSDKDFIPNTPQYSSALGVYISDITPNVFTDIKTRAVRVQTSSTGTPTDRVLTSTELYKLAQQGSYSSPSPSPTSTTSSSSTAE